MKYLLLLFSTFLIGSESFAQCCPYVDPIEIIPVSPNDQDSIYVVTNVTTPNAGVYLGYQIIDLGTTIRIEACYFNGMLTVLTPFTDTINIGVLPAGDYEIEFVAYQSNDWVNCDYADSNEVSDSIVVSSTLGFEQPENEIECTVFPNPVTDHMIYLKTELQNLSFILYNPLGQVIQSGVVAETKSIQVENLHGMYILKIQSGEHVKSMPVILQ